MSHTSRETSPDPLAGPTSPISSRFNLRERSPSRARRSSKPLAPRSHNIESPSKSFVMDTGAQGDASPWRIKVTVQAEPQEGSSPSKKVTRTTKVPLKGSSSPVKKSPQKKKALLGNTTESEIKRPQRKRKGTPIPRNVKRVSPEKETGEEDDVASAFAGGQIDMSQKLQEELSSPTKAPATRARMKGTPKPSPAERTRRLSKARAQLESLGNADETEDNQTDVEDAEALQSDLGAGDMTVANEDFTMISVATLESMKQGNSSQLLDNYGLGDNTAASISYMPSSPPRETGEEASFRQQDNAQYSNGSRHEEQDYAAPSHSAYDEMSWKPTGAMKTAFMLAKANKPHRESDPQSLESSECRLQREAVSREIEGASASQVIVIDSSHSSLSTSGSRKADDEEQAQAGAEEEDIEEVGDDDIWADEASRSIEEEQEAHPQQQQQHQQSSTAAALNDIFSDQASKPARSKIPRTWRRTSGMDFSYVDSPNHGALKKSPVETRDAAATSNGDDGKDDGVLTPPESSFEDEPKGDAEASGNEEDTDFDLTHPDAAATLLQVDEQEHVPRRRQDFSFAVPKRPARRRRDTTANVSQHSITESISSNSLTSNSSTRSNARHEEEDTGMFWQTNLPNVYQPPRQRRWGSKLLEERRSRKKQQELSELLDSSSNIDQQPKAAEHTIQVERSEMPVIEEKASSGFKPHSKTNEKVVDSPLRRSLLKSSKLGGNAIPTPAGSSSSGLASKHRSTSTSRSSSSANVSQNDPETTFGESFESKASDQRQLLTEMNLPSATRQSGAQESGMEASAEDSEDDIWAHAMSEATYDGTSPLKQPAQTRANAAATSQPDEQEEELEDDTGEEEHEDEDEDEQQEMPTRSYEENLNIESPQKIKVNFNDSEGNSSMLVPKKDYPPLFGTTSNSSQALSNQQEKTLVPTPPAQQGPGLISRLTSTIWSTLVRPSGPTMVDTASVPTFSPHRRTQIRNRYGVLSDQHPWTMAHMRTLHRLLNSSITGKADCLIPKSGPIPSQLKSLVGKELQCLTEFRWKFTIQHAYVVDAFMQTLVPSHFIDAIRSGEVAPLGDDFALQYRGNWSGRHGDDLVWDEETMSHYPHLRKAKGTIDRSFVVRALGNAISANIETAEREAKEKEDSEKIQAKKRAWERKMEVVHGDHEGDGTSELSTMKSSEMMPRVRRA